jgi:hypothetical protein
MKTHKKVFSILVLLFLLFAAGCKGDSTPSPSGDQSKGLPDGVDGTATITYEFTYNDDSAQSAVYVAIPVQLKIHAEDETVMEVIGDAYSTHYIQVKGAGGPEGSCFISCDYPIHYFYTGELNRIEENGKKGCSIVGEITQLYNLKDIQRSGTCPEVMIKKQDCMPFFIVPEGKWTFTADKLVDQKSEVPLQKATLSQVKFTQHIQKECGWKTDQ